MALEKEALGFWERLMKMKDKYGYWKLIKLVLFVGFAISFLYAAKNFGENLTFERQKEAITQAIVENKEQSVMEHEEQMAMRRDIKPFVSGVLQNAINEMNADRAFVIELHNGSNNSAGLPFIHCTMTYEENATDIEAIDEDYQNLSLSRFDFPEYLHKHDFWFGSIEDFAKIDKKMATRMQVNNATYMVIATLRSETSEIGYFGFTYCNSKEPKSSREITEFVVQSVQKLSKWLDNGATEEV